MIISKDIIDAKIAAKQAAEEARIKTLWDSIEAKIPEIEALTSDLADIIDTYFYVKKKDESAGEKLWSFMVQVDIKLGIDFCNGLDLSSKFGIRPEHLSHKEAFPHLYVTLQGGRFGKTWDDLYPLSEMKARLTPDRYGEMLAAITLLIEAVPEYKKRIAAELNNLLQ